MEIWPKYWTSGHFHWDNDDDWITPNRCFTRSCEQTRDKGRTKDEKGNWKRNSHLMCTSHVFGLQIIFRPLVCGDKNEVGMLGNSKAWLECNLRKELQELIKPCVTVDQPGTAKLQVTTYYVRPTSFDLGGHYEGNLYEITVGRTQSLRNWMRSITQLKRTSIWNVKRKLLHHGFHCPNRSVCNIEGGKLGQYRSNVYVVITILILDHCLWLCIFLVYQGFHRVSLMFRIFIIHACRRLLIVHIDSVVNPLNTELNPICQLYK